MELDERNVLINAGGYFLATVPSFFSILSFVEKKNDLLTTLFSLIWIVIAVVSVVYNLICFLRNVTKTGSGHH
jgi:uncharacterized Tic20 family protein